MKCIEVYLDPGTNIIRVSDKEATKLVAIGKAKYTNKQEWKANGRKYMSMAEKRRFKYMENKS